MPLIQTSAMGAAGQCSGGASGTVCGRQWWRKDYDGFSGVGEQMSALSIITANLISISRPLVGSNTGGTSQGDPSAGTGKGNGIAYVQEVTAAGKAGASILTFLVLVGVVGGGIWMSL